MDKSTFAAKVGNKAAKLDDDRNSASEKRQLMWQLQNVAKRLADTHARQWVETVNLLDEQTRMKAVTEAQRDHVKRFRQHLLEDLKAANRTLSADSLNRAFIQEFPYPEYGSKALTYMSFLAEAVQKSDPQDYTKLSLARDIWAALNERAGTNYEWRPAFEELL